MDGRPLKDLTSFQQDLLTLLAGLDEPSGQDVKTAIETAHDTNVTHSRIYPNLDTLADEGFVEKRSVSRRTNAYPITESGEEALLADLEWRVSAVED